MANKLFGIADPQYDALRILSNQAIEAGPGSGSTSGGGVENKIYVWHADASTLDVFDPIESGVDAALLAAATGDTIWLPSISIAMTHAITLPANTALRGIGHKAILAFSGFSGTALTMSAGSLAEDFTLTFVSNGTTAIGVSLVVADAIVNRLTVNVSGGTLVNHAINAGSVVGEADEVWMATYYNNIVGSINGIWWSTEFSNLLIATPTWHSVSPLPGSATLPNIAFDILHDGSKLFVVGADAGNANRLTVWECTNLATIRATPATTATWAARLYVGQSITTQLGSITVTGFNAFSRWSDGLTCTVVGGNHLIYGAYNGAWSFYDFGANTAAFYYTIAPESVALQTWGGSQAQDITLAGINGLPIGVTSVSASSYGISHSAWRSTINSDYYAVRFWYNGYAGELQGNYLFKYIGLTGAPAIDFISNPGITAALVAYAFEVRGALDGVSVVTVDPDTGALIISENRTALSSPATWRAGTAEELRLSGGGDLAWLCNDNTNGTEVVRVSDDRGVTWHDRTGNYWTLQGSGDFKSLNIRPVWLP